MAQLHCINYSILLALLIVCCLHCINFYYPFRVTEVIIIFINIKCLIYWNLNFLIHWQVELHSISGALVSRGSMLDALEYKINCEGQLRAHGGFDFSQPLGVTTVGQSREPINSWLPLYCTKQHWERVKVKMLNMQAINNI